MQFPPLLTAMYFMEEGIDAQAIPLLYHHRKAQPRR